MAVLTATHPEIQQVVGASQTRPRVGLDYADLTRKTLKVERLVDTKWQDFEPQAREVLTAYAYTIIDKSQGMPQTFWGRLRLAVFLFRLVLRRQEEAFFHFSFASKRLVNAILSQIERSNPAHRAELEETLEAAIADIQEGRLEALPLEEAVGRHRQLSRSILDEL